MQVLVRHCTDPVSRGRSALSAAAGLCAFGIVINLPSHAQALPQVVPVTEQAERDVERLRVLRNELHKAEVQIEALAKRKAERLAMNDLAAAEEADAQRMRTLNDIDGLRREIAAGASGKQPQVTHAAEATPSKPGRPVPRTVASEVPRERWWDVYGKERPKTTAFAVPSGTSSTQESLANFPIRRPE